MGVLAGPARYAGAAGRTRAAMGLLLSPGQWSELLAAEDLGELVRALTRTPYRDALSGSPGEAPDAGEVGRRLRHRLARRFAVFLPFLRGVPGDLMEWRWRSFELEDLKRVLRGLDRGAAAERIRKMLVSRGLRSRLPWDALAEASSVSEAAETLEGTAFGSALEESLGRYRQEGSLFPLEVALDLTYRRRLLRLVDRLRGSDRRAARRFIGTEADGRTLLWAFRYRIYFGLSPEEVLGYTLRGRPRGDGELLREVARGAGVHEVLQTAWGGRIRGVETLEGLDDRQALGRAAMLLRRHLHHEATKALRELPFRLDLLLAYQTLLRDEVGDLVALAEGRHRGRAMEGIRPHLVGERG